MSCMLPTCRAVALAAAATLSCSLPAAAAPTFVNGLTISGSLLDLSGGGSVNNGRLGFFSDLYYDPLLKQWWALSDRGPGGGTISYDTRVHRFSLDVNRQTGAIANFQIQQTVQFRNGSLAFNGLAPDPADALANALDPEGFVVNPNSGNLYVADEYGPSLLEFNRSGQLLRRFNVPQSLIPMAGANVDYTALPAPGSLTAGREPNRGLEGLAISPDGRFLYAMLQNGLLRDGNIASGGSFERGMFTRILKFETSTGNGVGQYAYRLDGSGTTPSQGRGISALVALDHSRFMVIERNNRGLGVPNANLSPPDKKIYIIDLSTASDVSGINLNTPLPSGVKPVAKASPALLDLAAPGPLGHPSLAALGGISPEKWEGLAVGPQLDDGAYLLLAGTDNDFSVTQNGSNTQFDVYFNPTTSERLQCDLGLTSNCVKINSNGSLGSNIGALPSGFDLIPAVLQAYKVSVADLGGYNAPLGVPGPLPLLGAATAWSWTRRLRARLRG